MCSRKPFEYQKCNWDSLCNFFLSSVSLSFFTSPDPSAALLGDTLAHAFADALAHALAIAFRDALPEAFSNLLARAFADALARAFADALARAFADALACAFADALACAFVDTWVTFFAFLAALLLWVVLPLRADGFGQGFRPISCLSKARKPASKCLCKSFSSVVTGLLSKASSRTARLSSVSASMYCSLLRSELRTSISSPGPWTTSNFSQGLPRERVEAMEATSSSRAPQADKVSLPNSYKQASMPARVARQSSLSTTVSPGTECSRSSWAGSCAGSGMPALMDASSASARLV